MLVEEAVRVELSVPLVSSPLVSRPLVSRHFNTEVAVPPERSLSRALRTNSNAHYVVNCGLMIPRHINAEDRSATREIAEYSIKNEQ